MLHNLITSLLGLIAMIAIGLGSWTMSKVTKQAEIIARMDEKMVAIINDNRENESQNEQLKKQWRYISKMKTSINELRMKNNLFPIDFE